jgi:hypothetical protein
MFQKLDLFLLSGELETPTLSGTLRVKSKLVSYWTELQKVGGGNSR